MARARICNERVMLTLIPSPLATKVMNSYCLFYVYVMMVFSA